MEDKLWIWTDGTELELPIYVAETARELALVAGTNEGNVRSSAAKWRKEVEKGKKTKRRFLCVEV